MRRLQFGVIGSCSDLNFSSDATEFAKKLGKLIAENGHTLIFGAEKDVNSLPTIAALSAKEFGGETVGLSYERGLDTYIEDSASVIMSSALIRGGGRETALMLSCDVVIAISGGSGTLTEMSIAYQAGVPVIAVTGFGGWSDKLAGTYLDNRKRAKFEPASTPEQAYELAFKSVKK